MHIVIGTFELEARIPHSLYLRAFGLALWVEVSPPYTDDRPFWERWTDGGEMHWRSGRLQGIVTPRSVLAVTGM